MNEELKETDPKQYEIVGWMSITAAILLFPSIVLGMVLEVSRKPGVVVFLLPYVLLFGTSMGLSLYVLYRFKRLLNDRYQFHDVDNIVTAILILGGVMGVVGIGIKIAGTFLKINVDDPIKLLPMALMAVGILGLIGLPLAILSIIFAVRLLRLKDSLFGLLKPYAYLTIVASALFATFLLAFLGFFLDAACSVLLGLIFLRSARGVPHPEFV
ncbi:MAG: hypothetical protein GTN89_04790 [Acidobacteria bacterium]|nr:hypothetical protein [Acidobacteriota bacterium]NIM60670.1 hypothetical protein [Acidobacteriota bacterium]NIO58630.1 hypothetical protein [Acidobacteriota bacterium]NIQ29686.1 hypothetical protein [Acidobacteriota bacterium]NIQ84403.1 hypothetical protein [Acidobacteriota bacterium]